MFTRGGYNLHLLLLVCDVGSALWDGGSQGGGARLQVLAEARGATQGSYTYIQGRPTPKAVSENLCHVLMMYV